jgi:hypothetical protein
MIHSCPSRKHATNTLATTLSADLLKAFANLVFHVNLSSQLRLYTFVLYVDLSSTFTVASARLLYYCFFLIGLENAGLCCVQHSVAILLVNEYVDRLVEITCFAVISYANSCINIAYRIVVCIL